MQFFAIRLRPGQDLGQELMNFVKANHLQAGFIMTCVGSLRRAALRMANQSETTILEDKFEIVSLVGTLDPEGYHLHLALSDKYGQMTGGHLQPGCLIYTTAEIVIGELEHLVFAREFDAETGYPELVISNR